MKEDGGQAFPGNDFSYDDGCVHRHERGSPGMNLRDWFAGQALAGLLYNQTISYERAAIDAYEYANAMISERGKDA